MFLNVSSPCGVPEMRLFPLWVAIFYPAHRNADISSAPIGLAGMQQFPLSVR